LGQPFTYNSAAKAIAVRIGHEKALVTPVLLGKIGRLVILPPINEESPHLFRGGRVLEPAFQGLEGGVGKNADAERVAPLIFPPIHVRGERELDSEASFPSVPAGPVQQGEWWWPLGFNSSQSGVDISR
jgi:hypothetical protein